jgi:Arc/MetJ family transcription regulator
MSSGRATVSGLDIDGAAVLISCRAMRTVVDIDEDALREARAALGTTTKVETVNRALSEVAALAARRRDLRRLAAGDLTDLRDDEIYAAAWQ